MLKTALNSLQTIKSLTLNFLKEHKILPSSKFKAIADDNFGIAKIVQSFFDQLDNAGYQPSLLLRQCFKKRLLTKGRSNSVLCGKG